MKEKLLNCEFCNEETRHITFKKGSGKGGSHRTKREVKHCTKCNIRTIKNFKQKNTYTKKY